jgi:hypothetical protein
LTTLRDNRRARIVTDPAERGPCPRVVATLARRAVAGVATAHTCVGDGVDCCINHDRHSARREGAGRPARVSVHGASARLRRWLRTRPTGPASSLAPRSHPRSKPARSRRMSAATVEDALRTKGRPHPTQRRCPRAAEPSCDGGSDRHSARQRDVPARVRCRPFHRSAAI